jgi:tape measure domain-containing protein
MADDLLIRAELRNEVAPGAAQVKTELRSIAAETQKVNAGSRAAADGTGVFERSLDRLGVRTRSVDSTLRSVSGTLTGSFARATSIVATGLVGIGAAVTVFGLKAASQFEQTHIAFEGLLGSVEKGSALFADLQKLNLRTPFELPEISQAARMLLGFQIQGERIVPLMKSITDIASGLGAGSEGLQRIVLNLGQVQAQGRVTGRELRDFATVGFPGYALVASILGKTREQVRAMGDDAVVSSDQFLDAVTKMSGPLAIFGGMAEKQMHSLAGLWSNVKDSFTVGVAGAVQPLIAQLEPMLAQGGLVPTFITQTLGTVGPPLTSLVGTLLELLTKALPAVDPILSALATGAGTLLTAMTPGLGALVPVGKELGDSLGKLFTALAPEMPTLVAAFVDLVKVLPVFVDLLVRVVPVVDPFLRLFEGILANRGVTDVLAGLLAVLLGYRALSAVVGAIRGVVTALGELGAATTLEATAEAEAAAVRSRANATGGIGSRMPVTTGVLGKVGGVLGIGLAADFGTKAVLGGTVGNETRGKRKFNSTISTDAGLIAGGTKAGGLFGAIVGTGLALANTGKALYDAHQHDRAYWGEKGDTASPRALGGNIATTLSWYSALNAGVPGRRAISNIFAGNAGGDHPAGRALDIVGDHLGELGSRVRGAGGYADMHGSHLHAVFGDTPSPRPARMGADPAPGGVVIMPGASLVNVERVESGVDLERAVQPGPGPPRARRAGAGPRLSGHRRRVCCPARRRPTPPPPRWSSPASGSRRCRCRSPRPRRTTRTWPAGGPELYAAGGGAAAELRGRQAPQGPPRGDAGRAARVAGGVRGGPGRRRLVPPRRGPAAHPGGDRRRREGRGGDRRVQLARGGAVADLERSRGRRPCGPPGTITWCGPPARST